MAFRHSLCWQRQTSFYDRGITDASYRSLCPIQISTTALQWKLEELSTTRDQEAETHHVTATTLDRRVPPIGAEAEEMDIPECHSPSPLDISRIDVTSLDSGFDDSPADMTSSDHQPRDQCFHSDAGIRIGSTLDLDDDESSRTGQTKKKSIKRRLKKILKRLQKKRKL